jgi:hypothetical protein
MGLGFPAGPQLEKLALDCVRRDVKLPSAVSGLRFSFPDRKAPPGSFRAGGRQEEIAAAVFNCIGKTLEKVIRKAVAETGVKEVLVVGGVAANSLIKARLNRGWSPPLWGRAYTSPRRNWRPITRWAWLCWAGNAGLWITRIDKKTASSVAVLIVIPEVFHPPAGLRGLPAAPLPLLPVLRLCRRLHHFLRRWDSFRFRGLGRILFDGFFDDAVPGGLNVFAQFFAVLTLPRQAVVTFFWPR